jgi:hypothetical protein
MIDLAYVIFAKQPILQQDLRLWNQRLLPDRTWPNMMQHLRNAQTDLSSLPAAGDIYHQQPPHQANVASTMADLVAQRLLDNQSILQNAYQAHPPAELPPPPPAPTDHLTDVANSLQRRETDLQSREASMMAQMQDMMMTMMRNGNNSNNNTTNNGSQHNNNRGDRSQQGCGGGGGRGCSNNRSGTRTHTRGYCWTHGACAHASNACNTPVNGHQNLATFDNMLNGSTNGCYWLT